jgi:hypothetical protein
MPPRSGRVPRMTIPVFWKYRNRNGRRERSPVPVWPEDRSILHADGRSAFPGRLFPRLTPAFGCNAQGESRRDAASFPQVAVGPRSVSWVESHDQGSGRLLGVKEIDHCSFSRTIAGTSSTAHRTRPDAVSSPFFLTLLEPDNKILVDKPCLSQYFCSK